MTETGIGDNYDWCFRYLNKSIESVVEIGSRDLADAIKMHNYFGCGVTSFECEPALYEACRNSIPEGVPIEVRSECLSNFDGYARFFVYDNGSSSLYRHRQLSPRAELELGVRRFDSLDIPIPDLLVMDAQSSEFSILQGFGSTLRSIKYLVFETGFYSPYFCDNNFDEIREFLKSQGFRFVATSVSGKGVMKLRLMRIRGIVHNVRLHGFRGFTYYSGFFDVLFENTKL